MSANQNTFSRRGFFAGSVASLAASASFATRAAEPAPSSGIVRPPLRPILLSVKLSMIAREVQGKKLTAVERLRLAAEAGFDGVDFDQAGEYTPEEARAAVRDSGVFVHNAINHAHWDKRLSSASPEDRERGLKNLRVAVESCWSLAEAMMVRKAKSVPARKSAKPCRWRHLLGR
jgi:L-ribulose-5-phosphate 3-epimerase